MQAKQFSASAFCATFRFASQFSFSLSSSWSLWNKLRESTLPFFLYFFQLI